MTVYTTVVTSTSTIFDFDNEATDLYVASTGVLASSALAVVQSTESDSSMVVEGSIISAGGDNCIYTSGDNNTLFVGQSGSVFGRVLFEGANAKVSNLGTLASETTAVSFFGESGLLNNYGSVIATKETSVYSAAVVFLDDVDDSQAATYVVNNYGNIQGTNYAIYGAEGGASYFVSDATVNNFGTIDGIIDLGMGDDVVVNSGTINGDVFLGGDSDIFDGRGGTVVGTVAGGDGDDIYLVSDTDISLVENANSGTDTVKSSVSFTLGANFENLVLLGDSNTHGTGNSLDNFIDGNTGNNKIYGLNGADALFGNGGDDRLFGGAGDDTLYGDSLSSVSAGDDLLRGGAGKDKLFGNDGNDKLVGGRGNDNLRGNDGQDILIGGGGKDVLRGGADEDVFMFRRALDSKLGNKADVIKDFEVGVDQIDLSGVVQGSLFYIDIGAFSFSGAEVQVLVSGGNTNVFVTRIMDKPAGFPYC